MRCPRCQHQSNESARFCARYRAPLGGEVGPTAMPRDPRARRACQAALAARDALRGYAETLRPRGIELAVRVQADAHG